MTLQYITHYPIIHDIDDMYVEDVTDWQTTKNAIIIKSNNNTISCQLWRRKWLKRIAGKRVYVITAY